jgi:hypothetical protein
MKVNGKINTNIGSSACLQVLLQVNPLCPPPMQIGENDEKVGTLIVYINDCFTITQ